MSIWTEEDLYEEAYIAFYETGAYYEGDDEGFIERYIVANEHLIGTPKGL